MKKNLLFLICLFGMQIIQSQTNWELLNPKPTSKTGKDVHFISYDKGYIITANEILETLDSGVSWQKKQSISGGNDMNFYNSIGYIVGNNAYVLKSTDSGNSWFLVSTGFNGDFNTVNLIDETTVIISSSNSIVKSNDGGATWESLDIANAGVNRTFFVNSLTGHAACNSGTMLKTTDGGQSWYVTQSTSTFPSDFFTVYFVNENVGFSSREHYEMYKTTDGGETWTEISGNSQAVFDFYFLDENNGFITGDSGATFKTTDGGNTWEWIGFQNGYVYNTSMYGIYFLDNNTGYATGARGRIIKTIDGGNTWTQHSPTYNEIKQAQFFDSGIGYAQIRNDYFKTTDEGNNWFLVGTADHYSQCQGFHFINESVGYSIGGGNSNSGDVLKTIDGGVTWNHLEITVNDGLNSVFFIDENTGFISGGYNQRKVLKTTNGGTSWQQVLEEKFGQIQFLNNQVGYAHRIGYSNGRMYKTIDGGNTWSICFEGNDEINAFHFVDEDNGYFVGEVNLIHKTTDGGANWQEFEIPYDWYETVKFYSKNIGYIGDEDGMLYKTMNGGVSWEYLTAQYGLNSIQIANDVIYTAGLNGKILKSDVEYDPVVLYVYQAENIYSSSSTLSGNVTSNEGLISNIRFEYGTGNSFENTVAVTPNFVSAHESENFSVDLVDLNHNTTYFFRIKATYNSIEHTSEIESFTTNSDYTINLYIPEINGNQATLSALVFANGQDITNIVFEYGTLEYENFIATDPDQVFMNSSNSVSATISDLDPDVDYYYRLKALYGTEIIYSEEGVFNITGSIILTAGSLTEYGDNSIELIGLINCYGAYLSDIKFEYGTTESFGSSINGDPDYVWGYGSRSILATISDLEQNQIYFYKLTAINDGNTLQSGTYQFTTLNIGESNYDNTIQLFPNPASNIINITTTGTHKINSVEFYNASGKPIIYYENPSLSDFIEIDLRACAKGVYFIKMEMDNNKTITKKLFIE